MTNETKTLADATKPERMTFEELYAGKDAADMCREASFRRKMGVNTNASNDIARKMRNTKDGSPANLKAKAEYARLRKESDGIAEEWNDGTWRKNDPYFAEYERGISASRPAAAANV